MFRCFFGSFWAWFWGKWDDALYHVEDDEPMRSEFVDARTIHHTSPDHGS
jgi:hypothetical protein